MLDVAHRIGYRWSLPTRERGLKYADADVGDCRLDVAPHAGAWIEMRKGWTKIKLAPVAPHAGAWIEIYPRVAKYSAAGSRSPRGSVD